MRTWFAFTAVILLTITALLPAHMTPNSELVLNFNEASVTIDAIVPEGDYVAAAGVANDRNTARAARWLAGEVAATSNDGRSWRVEVLATDFVQRNGPPDLHAVIRLTPPAGADPRRLTLLWSPVVAQNPDHFALILVGSDHGAGVLPSDRRLIGAVRGNRPTIAIDRGDFRASAAFAAAFRLGMEHIAGGTDHLMFLLALLLPAALVAQGRRWQAGKSVRATATTVATIITAFTVGHSLTLIITALGGWRLPSAPVEIAIALSILVAALHAIRPIFAGREAWVAAGFGLVHGLAFATLVGDAGVGGAGKLLSILGFNLGIEAVQLLVAAMALMPIMLITHLPVYRFVRTAGGLVAAAAAIGWLIERSIGGQSPISVAVAVVADHAPTLWLLMMAASLAAWQFGQRRRTARPDEPLH